MSASLSRLKLDITCNILELNGSTFVCFVRPSDDGKLSVCLSDGAKAWRKALSQCNEAECEQIRSLLVDGNVKVSISENSASVTLRSTKDDKTLTYDLETLAAAEAQSEIGVALIMTARRSIDLEKQLAQAEKQIDALRRSAAAHVSAHTNVFDMNSSKQKKAPQKATVKQPGMSVINPGSRKRSKAQGIEYD